MMLTTNLPFKLLSVFLAFFVWYLAKYGAETIDRSFSVPLIVEKLPDNYLITSELPSQINVLGRISRRRSNRFNPGEIQAIINMSYYKPGRVEVNLMEGDHLETPKDLKVVQVQPDSFELVVEELITKELEVSPRYQGQLPKGFVIQSVAIEPKTVKVRGPKSVLEHEERLFTNEIDLRQLSKTTSIPVRLERLDKNVRRLDQGVDFYTAIINIDSIPVKRRFDDIPILLENLTYVTLVNPKTFSLYLEGPEGALDQVTAGDLRGVIDLSQYTPGGYKVRPEPTVPQGLTVLQSWPTVSLWVKNELVAPGTQPPPAPTKPRPGAADPGGAPVPVEAPADARADAADAPPFPDLPPPGADSAP